MRLGLTVSLVALGVIAVLGALGYLMDKQVDRDERKEGASSFSSDSDFSSDSEQR